MPLDNLHSHHALVMHVQAEINCAELTPAYSPLHRILVNDSGLELLVRGDTARVNRG